MLEPLHEQLLRKLRSDYVRKNSNFDDMASGLSHRLHDALVNFLNSNSILPIGQAGVIWARDLREVFLGALQLKAQIALRSGQHSFCSPAVDYTFNAKAMVPEVAMDVQGGSKVLVTLFPMLVQRKEPQTGLDDEQEEIIFPATVVLQ